MNELDVKRVLQKAIDTYGMYAQLDMCIEEMSELTKAICKLKRVRAQLEDKVSVTAEQAKKVGEAVDNIEEETADVLIMLEQIKMMFDSHNIEQQTEHKVKRLAERLGMNNQKVTTCDKKEYWG